ncbi:MAG: S-layer homology domain-containing protein [Selenomonadaceae bacterium]
MKKLACTALLSLTVTGTSLASAAPQNPFEDVPTDHWAYDAVAELAADDVIEGYGDGTYRGDAAITRYEMAQMVARAMTKQDVSAADKAVIDKLAAEFADELNSLGVRVAALEKKVDNVKWKGEVRYRFITQHQENDMQKTRNYMTQFTSGGTHKNTNQFMLRLLPSFDVNEHWSGHARINYYSDMHSAENVNSAVVDWLWAEGHYGNTTLKLGKLIYFTEADYGMFNNDPVAGAQLSFGNEVKATLTAGRYNFSNGSIWYAEPAMRGGNEAGNYQGIEIYNDRKDKINWGVSYHHMNAHDRYKYFGMDGENANIFGIGAGWRMTPTMKLTASYLRNTDVGAGTGVYEDIKDFRDAYSIELQYKEAKRTEPGSFSVFAAYRKLGPLAVLYTTHHVNGGMREGDRGFEVGASYTFARNILGSIRYFKGKSITPSGEASLDRSALLGEVHFYF